MRSDVAERAARLVDALGRTDARVFRAPGRVNIIGEHVDYTGGLVLPFACDREVLIACVPSEAIEVESLDGFGRATPRSGWGRYVFAVASALRDAGLGPVPIAATVGSTVPVGAGLSSSAALEAAVALGMLGGRLPDPEVLQRAEHLAVGVPCGVMDQVAVLQGAEGCAILLDCATVRAEQVPLPRAVEFVVLDTGTRRALDDGRYRVRSDEAREGVRLACAALAAGRARDLTRADVAQARLGPVLERRVRHVVSENLRVELAVAALRVGDASAIGAILDESHRSLRDDFEVSSHALDLAVETARTLPGCLGARMVGAGFAGCALAAAESGAAATVAQAWTAEVSDALAGARGFEVRAAAGAGEVDQA